MKLNSDQLRLIDHCLTVIIETQYDAETVNHGLIKELVETREVIEDELRLRGHSI